MSDGKHGVWDDNELEEVRNKLRNLLHESSIIPYVTVEWFNDTERENGKSPLAHTCMVFETIINTLMASYGSYQSMVAVNFLSHLTVTLDQLTALIGEVLIEENNPKLQALLGLLKEREGDDESNINIPDVFTEAFKDEDNA